MTHRERVVAICEFVRSYRSGNLTPRHIYNETGYGSHHAEIAQEDIAAVVASDPSLVDDWLAFTTDKRWTPAWGLERRGDSTWLVFYVFEGGGQGHEIAFASPIHACALMIRMEMESLRLSTPSGATKGRRRA